MNQHDEPMDSVGNNLNVQGDFKVNINYWQQLTCAPSFFAVGVDHIDA